MCDLILDYKHSRTTTMLMSEPSLAALKSQFPWLYNASSPPCLTVSTWALDG